MDPVTIGAIAAPIVGGLIGGSSAKRSAQEAARLRAQALAQFAGISVPGMEDQLYNLLGPSYIGDLAAAQEESVQIDPSAMEEIAVDPRLKQEQMRALESISQRADQGLTPEDMMAFQQARRGGAAEAQAKQEQILQSMQQRGIGGAGAELAARLMAAQAGGDRASQESMQVAQESARQRDANMKALASLSSSVRGQEFDEQSAVARAKDTLEQFRAQNTQGVRSRNVSRAQDVANRNINERQRIADVGTQTRNVMEQRRGDLYGDQFGREIQLAGARSGALTGAAGSADAEAARRAQSGATIGSGVGNILASFIKKNDDKKTPGVP